MQRVPSTLEDETDFQLLDSRSFLNKQRQWCSPSHIALDAVNFFVADAQSLGALAYIYCTSSPELGGLGMAARHAGLVLLMQGILGVIAGPPLGWYIDKSTEKKKLLSGTMVLISLTWIALAFTRNAGLVAVLLGLQGVAGAVFPPGINGLSQGIVGYNGFPARAARNEQWRHGGAIVGAILPILVVGDDGNYKPLFLAYAGIIFSAVLSLQILQDKDIDHDAARGDRKDAHGEQIMAVPLTTFFTRKDVVLFSIMVVTWHFANAPMLPQVGFKIQELYERDPANAASFKLFGITFPLDGKNGISVATIVAQIIMIPVAHACGWLSTLRWAGSKKTLMLATITITIRGFVFASSEEPWFLLIMCFLDGIGAGAFGVCAVLMVSDLTQDTGRCNLLQGVMAACVGVGGSISNGLSGGLVEKYSVNMVFITLAICALFADVLLAFVHDLHDYNVTDEENTVVVPPSLTREAQNLAGSKSFMANNIQHIFPSASIIIPSKSSLTFKQSEGLLQNVGPAEEVTAGGVVHSGKSDMGRTFY
eukprot:g15876.t1